MSSFTKYDASLTMQYHSQASALLGRDHWVVTEPFTYYLDSLDSNLYVTVPRGFLTDGASVPRLFWKLIPPWGGYGQAAVLHDYLCEFAKITNGKVYFTISRVRCDNTFLQAIDVLSISNIKKRTLTVGVNFYRNFTRPPAPKVNLIKREIEEQITLTHFRTGKFELLDYQIRDIKNKFKFK